MYRNELPDNHEPALAPALPHVKHLVLTTSHNRLWRTAFDWSVGVVVAVVVRVVEPGVAEWVYG